MRKRIAIVAGVALALVVGAGLYLTQVVLPRTMEGLGRAINSTLRSAAEQAGRLTPPEPVPSGSRIWLDRTLVGEITIRFRVASDPSPHPVPTGPRSTGLLGILENSDTSTVFAGKLTDPRAATAILSDSELVAMLVSGVGPGVPIDRKSVV